MAYVVPVAAEIQRTVSVWTGELVEGATAHLAFRNSLRPRARVQELDTIALLPRLLEGETDMTRTVRTSDEPVQSCENSKLGPPLDRRTFLIGAGAAAGQGFPVSTMAQSTASTSSVYRR